MNFHNIASIKHYLELVKATWALIPISLFSFLIGSYSKTKAWIKDIKPTKKAWDLKDTESLTICMSSSTDIQTGQHNKPTTGVGQVKAFGYIVESISSAYNLNNQNIFLSNESVPLKNDLILLGGSKHNRITKRFLEKIDDSAIANQIENKIIWIGDGKKDTCTYIGESNGTDVTKDFGLIIKMPNPFSTSKPNNSTIFLFAGCHTYGTIAAAKYFTETYIEEMPFFHNPFKKKNKHLFIVVKCDVYEKNPVCIESIEKYEF